MAKDLIRWDPFREAISLREAMDRLFEESFVGWPGWREREGEERVMRLPLDVYSTGDELIFIASVPGMEPDDVEITIEGDTLTIRGELKQPEHDGAYIIRERPYGRFERVVNLNVPVNPDKAEATFENGLLKLRIPKAEAVKTKVIKVKTKK